MHADAHLIEQRVGGPAKIEPLMRGLGAGCFVDSSLRIVHEASPRSSRLNKVLWSLFGGIYPSPKIKSCRVTRYKNCRALCHHCVWIDSADKHTSNILRATETSGPNPSTMGRQAQSVTAREVHVRSHGAVASPREGAPTRHQAEHSTASGKQYQ